MKIVSANIEEKKGRWVFPALSACMVFFSKRWKSNVCFVLSTRLCGIREITFCAFCLLALSIGKRHCKDTHFLGLNTTVANIFHPWFHWNAFSSFTCSIPVRAPRSVAACFGQWCPCLSEQYVQIQFGHWKGEWMLTNWMFQGEWNLWWVY